MVSAHKHAARFSMDLNRYFCTFCVELSFPVFFFPGLPGKKFGPGIKMATPGNAILRVPGKKLGAPGKKY